MAPRPRSERRATRPGQPQKPEQAPARSAAPIGAARRFPERAWPIVGLLALAVLLWACRGARLGTPVVDDYSFLDRLAFQNPLDPFDSMGASYYWRPLGRQLYFSLVGPWLIAAPWGAAAIHAVLLLALFAVTYLCARRGFSPAVAAAIAAFPLLSESARVLLGWPSASQHLIAMVAVTVAIHETLAWRPWTAAVAALAGLLSHDAAVVVLPTLPAIAWVRSHDWKRTLPWLGVAVALVAVWGAGYAIALSHGVALPPKTQGAFPLGDFPGVLAKGLVAQLNLEDLPDDRRAFFGTLYVIVFATVAALLFGAEARRRLKAARRAIEGGLWWFVIASAPLTLVLPDWNAWRGSVPALGLGLALVGIAGIASPWLAGAVIALKLATLGLAMPAPAMVASDAPPTASHMSFVRLARLQIVVEAGRLALTQRYPTLPRGADVRFWSLPRMAEVGFQGPRAARVWYRDSTLNWGKFGGVEGMKRNIDAMVEFEYDHPVAAMVVEPRALDLFRQGMAAFLARNMDRADSLFVASLAAQPQGSDQFYGSVARNRARVAFNKEAYARADSLNEMDFKLAGPTPGYYSMVARLALVKNDRVRAITAIRLCLMYDPNDRDGLTLARIAGLSQGGP